MSANEDARSAAEDKVGGEYAMAPADMGDIVVAPRVWLDATGREEEEEIVVAPRV